jgi:catechol 2,3-dioxygenase-like lactoylglutathione lyase family enzyme
MPVEVIGIDHIYLAVRDLRASEAFYDRVKAILGFRKLTGSLRGEAHVHYYGRQFGLTLRPARPGAPAHDSYAPGLHHLCLRVLNEAAVDAAAAELRANGIEVSAPRTYPEYSPDYYALFFSDPDGVRLEICNFWKARQRRMFSWDTEIDA